jgi:Holliday junction resolvasome RuvABC endonuclease subunit
MSAPRVAGLDLSLTGTGVAVAVGGGMWAETITPRKLRGHDRLEHILSNVREAVRGADLAVIEGPSLNSRTGHPHERGGLWWAVAHGLWLKGIPYAVVPPATLKQYATGKGTADKDVMWAAADWYLHAVVDQLADDNQVDAGFLAAAGRRWLGQPIDTTPPEQWAALQNRTVNRKGKPTTVGPQWPDLTNRIAA